MDDTITCPKCKTTKYRNPLMVMKVNVCGHALCESCVELLFVKGSGACPECNVPLRKQNFRIQLFEDSAVDKEVDIRRKILKEYNKRQEDFATLKDYNDYLEEVETIIFNLVYDIDITATNKAIDTYKKENKDLIQRNKNKASQEEIELEELLEMEELARKERAGQHASAEIEEIREKRKANEKLIDELMFSDANAKDIVASHKQSVAAQEQHQKETSKASNPSGPVAPILPNKFSSGVRIGMGGTGQSIFLPVPRQPDVPLYHYTAPVFDYNGPTPPPMTSLSDDYLRNIRSANAAERAGGYTHAMSCCRALQEAMGGLFYIPQSGRRILSTAASTEEMELS